MAIKADHSQLPKPQRAAGNPPDQHPRFVRALADKLRAERERLGENGGKAHAREGTRLRHSDAGKCARALALGLAGFPREPIDDAGVHVMNLGTLVHDAWQAALVEQYGDAVQVEVECQVDGLDASGHIDAVFYEHYEGAGNPSIWTIAYELKTMGGFGYKMAVGERGAPDGPRHSALTQAALNAYAVDADELVVGVIATEAISKGAAAKKGIDDLTRFAAEWTYSRDEYEPIAKAETARLQRILDLYDDGQLAPTSIPDPEVPRDALVVDPSSGRWEVRDGDEIVDTGSTWMCGYCPHQSSCAAIDTPGEVAVDAARRAVGIDDTRGGEAA